MKLFANRNPLFYLLIVPIMVANAGPLNAQDDTTTVAQGCRTRILAEQLRDGCFNYDVLGRVIPGFADLIQQDRPLCTWTVYLTHPASQADSARKILAPLVRAPEPGVCSQTGIRVARSRYTWARLRAIEARASDIIDSAGYIRLTYANIRDARIVITAHNRRALERMRVLLSRDPIVRASLVSYEMADGPEEMDRPVVPPRAATLIVLDSLARRYAHLDTVVFNASSLPAGVSVADLIARGLRLEASKNARCPKKRNLFFEEIRQWVDGRIQYTVFEVNGAFLYEVTCTATGCRPSRPRLPGGGLYVDWC